MKAIFLGIIFLIGGFLIIFNPKFYSHLYGMTIDFSRIKFPLGIAFIIIGLILFWSYYKDKKMVGPGKNKPKMD